MLVDLGKINQQLNELSKVEERLNQRLASREFRKQLFDNPVKVLRKEGIVLPKDKERSITDLFKSAKVPADKDLRVGSSAAAPGIFIYIAIRF